MTTENENSNITETNLRGYLFFLAGQWISILGSNIVQFGLIWYLIIVTESPVILALAAFFGLAPFYIATPFAGVFIDRWSRKKVIVFVDLMQAVFTVILIFFFINLDTLFTISDLVLAILAISIPRGIFGAFHTAAVDTLLPIMIPKTQLSRINGINYLVNGAISIVGPIVGAITLAFVEMKDLLYLDVITFLLALIPTIIIFIPQVRKKSQDTQKISFKAEISEGLTFIRSTKGLLPLLAAFAGVNFFIAPIFTQFPLLIKTIHLGDERVLALLLSTNQVGLIIGSIIMSSWKGFDNSVKGVAWGMFLLYIGLLIIALAQVGNFLVIALGFAITGFVLPVMNVSSETIWAKTVPRELLGRVYAVRRTIAQFTFPIAVLIGGFFAEVVGLVMVFTACAIFGMLLFVYSWFLTPMSRVDQTTQENLVVNSGGESSPTQR